MENTNPLSNLKFVPAGNLSRAALYRPGNSCKECGRKEYIGLHKNCTLKKCYFCDEKICETCMEVNVGVKSCKNCVSAD
jgi:hypothetical protein